MYDEDMYDEDMPVTYDNINYYTSEIAFYLKECDKLETCLRDYIQKKEDKKLIEAMNGSLVFYREIVRKYTEKLERAVYHIKHFGPESIETPYTVVDLDNDCIGYVNDKALYRTCLYELFYEETESRFAFYGLPCDDLSSLTPFTSLPENEQRQILSILNSKSELREWIAKYKKIQKIRKKLKVEVL